MKLRPLSEHEQVFLADLAQNPTFLAIIEENVKPQIPELPAYEVDENSGDDNKADWMRNSLFRDGFMHCLKLLGVANVK